MPMTRANLDRVLIRIEGDMLAEVGRDGTTIDGTNQDLSIGIALALMRMGKPVADMLSVTDEELAELTGLDQPMLIDIARCEVLENVLSNWVEADWVVGTDNEQRKGQLRESIRKQIADWKAQNERKYGVGDGAGTIATTSGGLGTLSAGSIDLNFAARVDDEP